MCSAARSLASAGGVGAKGVATRGPAVSPLPTVSRCHWRSNVCRGPTPRSRLPVWVTDQRPRRVKAAPEVGRSGVGALVLALTGVVHLPAHTGGSFTSSHLASSFPVLTLDIESLSRLAQNTMGWNKQ